jgi:hypothetical protein
MHLPLPWEIKARWLPWASPMKLPPDGTRHDQTGFPQTLNQMLGTYGVNQAASGSVVQAEASLSRVVFFPTL